jgi:hypothetical protein
MQQLEIQDKRLLIAYGTGEEKPGFSEAAKLCCYEKVTLINRVSREHPDYQGPAEAPWS